MTLSNFKAALAAAILVFSAGSAFSDDVHAVRSLPGYQCMVLAKLWDGEGPQPPAVHVFAGPSASSPRVGVAGGSIIVSSPLQVIDGRTNMLFADGRSVWINASDIAPFRVASNPHATCTPVLLSNGRYGFQTKH